MHLTPRSNVKVQGHAVITCAGEVGLRVSTTVEIYDWLVWCGADVKEVFDLFDFWDGRDGLVDGAKIGDVMRCIGLNPTNKQILENGGTKKFGQFISERQ